MKRITYLLLFFWITLSYGQKCQTSKRAVWNGSHWIDKNGAYVSPDITRPLVLKANYVTKNKHRSFEGCNLRIRKGVKLVIRKNNYVKIQKNIKNYGTIIVKNKANLVQVNQSAKITGKGSCKAIVIPPNGPHSYYDYSFLSTPLNNLYVLENAVYNAWRYYSFDGATQSWHFEQPTGTMNPGKGYAISYPLGYVYNPSDPPFKVIFKEAGAKFNSGDITTPVYITGVGAQDDDDWNLIGNPYPSAIDFDAFVGNNNNIQGAYYLWTNCAGLNSDGQHQIEGYTTYSVGSGGVAACTGNGPTAGRYLAVAQAFYVEANTAGNVTFMNSQRSTNYTNYLNRSTVSDRIWLNFSNNLKFQQILIGFYPDATDGLDRLYDARNIDPDTFGFYSLLNQNKLAIQGLPVWQDFDKVVPIGFTTDTEGEHRINVNKTEGLLTDKINVYLHDLYNDSFINLKKYGYTFQSNKGTYDDRFELIFSRNSLDVKDFSINNGLNLISNNGNFKIISKNNNIKSVVVYSLEGKEIANVVAKLSEKTIDINLNNISHQILIFKVLLDDGKTAVIKGIR